MPNNLKDLTRDHHMNAERSAFAEMLISGDIHPKLYQEYLYAQAIIYSSLEEAVELPEDLHGMFRTNLIIEDLHELEDEYGLEEVDYEFEAVNRYVDHIEKLKKEGDNESLLAHVYVRHFGDMHGGQIIKKKTPGSGVMYEFEGRSDLIAGLRHLLHDGMVDEAQLCFEYAERLFVELIDKYVDEDEYADFPKLDTWDLHDNYDADENY